eukprot:m.68499 g.68499  ORF g.68499 m.68499 type:complete len:340 (+) comp7502_c0_seq1:147-1166(+)
MVLVPRKRDDCVRVATGLCLRVLPEPLNQVAVEGNCTRFDADRPTPQLEGAAGAVVRPLRGIRVDAGHQDRQDSDADVLENQTGHDRVEVVLQPSPAVGDDRCGCEARMRSDRHGGGPASSAHVGSQRVGEEKIGKLGSAVGLVGRREGLALDERLQLGDCGHLRVHDTCNGYHATAGSVHEHREQECGEQKRAVVVGAHVQLVAVRCSPRGALVGHAGVVHKQVQSRVRRSKFSSERTNTAEVLHVHVRDSHRALAARMGQLRIDGLLERLRLGHAADRHDDRRAVQGKHTRHLQPEAAGCPRDDHRPPGHAHADVCRGPRALRSTHAAFNTLQRLRN